MITAIHEITKKNLVTKEIQTYYEVERLESVGSSRNLARLAKKYGKQDLWIKYHMLAKPIWKTEIFHSLNHTKLKVPAANLRNFLNGNGWIIMKKGQSN